MTTRVNAAAEPVRWPLVLSLALLGPLLAAWSAEDVQVISPGYHHLGDNPTPEWPEAPAVPTRGPLEITFQAKANASEQVLSIRQRHVDDEWTLALNGQSVGVLERHGESRECFYALPAGALRDGVNTLVVSSPSSGDDLTLGEFRLHRGSLREVLDLAQLAVSVSQESGEPVPARITMTDAAGQPLTLRGLSGSRVALRQGLVYTDGGAIQVELPRGEIVVHASRGPEWSHAETRVVVGRDPAVALTLRRELDTRGWVAVDTHVHTLTHSGHGDATLEERVLTLAGEGVELAVATDHNHHTDYRPAQEVAGLQRWFTPVTGNEVTTSNGHFNAFPLDPTGELPRHDASDWVVLVDDMRAKGALAVILNHPRWPAHDTGPFGEFGLDLHTGARLDGGMAFSFDALELVNSTTATPDPMVLFHDWFALLNRGERIFAVGSSDSHTVGDPVGRGRTYVRCPDDEPSRLDPRAIALDLADGHASVSLGMIIDVRVEGRSAMGQTLLVDDQEFGAEVRLQAPSWVRPNRIVLFLNGRPVQDRPLSPPVGAPLDLRLPLSVGIPRVHDAWLVVAAFGPGAGGAWWPGLDDYTLAATNPLFLDVDGDGTWQSPRDVARSRWKGIPNTMDMVDLDEAATLQYLDLADEFYDQQADKRLKDLADGLARRNPAVAEFLEQRTGGSH